jgi:tetratricopeptide (TPR) repeat protein
VTFLAVTVLLAACTNPADRAAKYLVNAQALYDKGDYKKADIEARNAAQIEPKNAKARYLLALIAEKQQNYQQMFGHLAVAVDSDPKFVAARVKLGTLYFLGQAYDKAAAEAKAAMALEPDNLDVHVLNARLLLQKKDIDAGLKELDLVLAKKPDMLEALLLKSAALATDNPDGALQVLDAAIPKVDAEKAKTLREMRIGILASDKRQDAVEEGFRSLVRDYPKDERLQYQLARFYASQGRVDDAEKVMRSVIALDPADVGSRLGLAQFLAEMRSPDAAEKALEAFVAQTPDALPLRLALGRVYEVNKKPDAAMSAYQDIAKKDPKSKEGIAARVRIAAIELSKTQIEQGRAQINSILTDVPDQTDALLMHASLQVNDKKYNEAVADVRTVMRKETGNKRAMLMLARIYALKGDQVLAKDAYRQLLTLDPGNTEAPRELAQVEIAGGNLAGAQEVLRKRLEKDSKDFDARVRMVDLMLTQKNFGGAETEALEIARLDDQKGIGELQLARAYQAQKKNPQAVEAFKRALAKNPEWNLPLEGLVMTLLQMDKKDDAVNYLQGHLQKYPKDLSARYLLGATRQSKGEIQEAARIYESVVAEKPDATLGWLAIAGLYPKDAGKRIATLQRGLKANPANADIGMLLGSEYENAGRFDEAIVHYEQLLKTNPKLDLAANNLASILLDRRTDPASYSRALDLTKRFDQATNAAFLDSLGWAYYRNREYAKAVPYLERAVAGAGQAQVLRYHLGMAYLATKNTAGAKQELTKAVGDGKSGYPGLEEARATLKRLNGPG